VLKAVSASVFGLALAGTALAQQDNNLDQLQEITVTAQKRESTVQATPISITAITGQDLQDRGITNISSIVQTVPGVSQRTSGPGQTELEIRGTSSAGGNSSTVGFYLGDVPLTAPASAQNGKVVIDPDLYDLNRVEVLRGPQGTLYGSGSLGGTIKLVPNAPDPKAFDAGVETILGHTSGSDTLNNDENVFVNLPLSDTAAVRIVGSQEHLGGWIDRKVIAEPDFPSPTSPTTRGNVAAAPVQTNFRDVNDEVLTSARIALLWNATDRLSISPSFLYQKITQDGLSLIDTPPGTNNQYQPFNSPEPFQDRIDIGALNVQYHFDIADLSSTTSFWTRDENLRQDGTEELAYAFGGISVYPAQGGLGPTAPAALEDDKSKQYSEEVRLTSAGDTAFKWLVGYFYQDFESDFDEFLDTPFTAVPGTITDAFDQVQPTKILQNSFFGEASYTFLQQFTVTAGLRRYYYHGTVNTAVS
jgi:outer membrane receptor protein involved in Fe transport